MWCNTQCKHISLGTQRANTSQEPQGSGLSASRMEVSFYLLQAKPHEDPCVLEAPSVWLGRLGLSLVLGTRRHLSWVRGVPGYAPTGASSDMGANFHCPSGWLLLMEMSHEELESPHLLKMSKHRGTALGIRIRISEITVSVINPYIYLLIFILEIPSMCIISSEPPYHYIHLSDKEQF